MDRVVQKSRESAGSSRGDTLASHVGETPLVPLQRIGAGSVSPSVLIQAKCEWMNPAGSVKDRPALWMIRDAEERGLIREGCSLLDSTSGNTGIALAQIAAARGHRLTLCMPANASIERKRILRLLGADLILTDPTEGSDGARNVAREMARREPGRYVFLDQYSNPANWRAHYESTSLEIWRQTGGRLTHFVACLGTTGTFTGVSRRLIELNPAIERITVEPDAPFHGIEGTKHLGSTEVPEIFDPAMATRRMNVSTDEAQAMARRLAREEGLPSGTSGGAAAAAALRIAAEIEAGMIVLILPDNAMRSISESIWEEGETWRRE